MAKEGHTEAAGAERIGNPEFIDFTLRERAEYFYPGSMVNEASSEDVNGRSLQQLASEADSYAFAVRTYKDVVGKVEVEGAIVEIKSAPFNISGLAYIDGEVFTLDDVKNQFPEHRTLISNMEGNRWDKVVRSRCGNWQPFNNDDSIISTQLQAV